MPPEEVSTNGNDCKDKEMFVRFGGMVKALSRRRKRRDDPPREKIGLLAIMKNEAMNLREWVEHYRWQGVDRIFLIDNGSTDGGPELIEKEIHAGYVELFVRPESHQQWAHYQAALVQARICERVEWLVMADLDEFWFSPGSDLRTALALDDLREIDLIYANWKMFGACGHQNHPPGLRRHFTLRNPALGQHADTKWICRTDAITHRRNISIHKVSGVDSARVVSDNVHFHLNHYPIQSLEYFTKVKMTRGDASSPGSDTVRTLDYFHRYDAPATCEDRLLADSLPPDVA